MNDRNKIKNGNVRQTFIAIFAMILLTIGATFAYYLNFGDKNLFETKTIRTSTGSLGGGAVLTKQTSSMSLDLSLSQMLPQSTPVTYYANTTGPVTDPTTLTIASVSVEGDGIFDCNYKLNISKTSTNPESDLYNAFHDARYTAKGEGQIVLVINDSEGNTVQKDFNDEIDFPIEISNTITNVSSVPKDITAQMYFVNNPSIDQTFLNNKNVALNFTFSEFKCNIK